MLAAVNHLFGAAFGDGYQPLAASSEFPDPVFGHPVELLVTDKESYRAAASTGGAPRRSTSRGACASSSTAGAATPGEIVLLFAAGTDAEWYEEELRALGLPTYRATGRRYFGQQQVVDLLMYLRLLRNRYDDEALVAVLASPFVGVSNDALVLLRRHTGRRPLYTGIERSLPDALDAADERLIRAFKQRYERLVAASARVSLERLCELVVSEHDYDLAVLARWDGQRRYANLRKLMRLARSYEELRGRDLEGFLRFIRDQEALGAAQLEAVSEEEGAGAVRLLTIHAAKGLEFKVVVVADAGRELAGPDAADEILAFAAGDARGGASGRGRGAPAPLLRRDDARDRPADRLRRGRGGARDADRLGPLAARLRAGARRGERSRSSSSATAPRSSCGSTARSSSRVETWRRRCGAARTASSRSSASCRRRRPRSATGCRSSWRCRSRRSTACGGSRTRRSRSSSAARTATTPSGSPACASGAARSPETTAAGWRRRRSAMPCTGCSSCRDPEHRASSAPGTRPSPTTSSSESAASSMPTATPSWRSGSARPRGRSWPFAFEHDGVLLHGRLDILQRDGARALVVDYKTNVLGERDPGEVVETEYRLQRLVYALACFRAGADEVEVVYSFLERPDALVSTLFGRDDVAALEAELSAAIARIDAGEFVPTPSDFACMDCPALDVVCAGPRLRGGGSESLAARSPSSGAS